MDHDAVSIRADDLSFVLAALRLRRYSGGRTCLLAAVTSSPRLDTDCSNGRTPSADWVAEARRLGFSTPHVTPLDRGHIARVYERTRRLHGLAEVRATWSTGIRALRAEPRYVLHPGATA